MITFEQIWRALYDNGASDKKEEGTRRYWETLTPEQQERAFTTITRKLREGGFVWYDPIRAIQEALKVRGRKDERKLSFQEYYQRYGTTEERDGWKMANPTGQQVIYVKAG